MRVIALFRPRSKSTNVSLGQILKAPDRKYTIAFGSFAPVRPTLFITDGNGEHAQPLLADPGVDYNASFSHDGTWIVFTSEKGGSADIHRIHPDGTALERLTDDPAFDDQGVLSPDGRTLAFVSTRGGAPNIWLLDLATRSVTLPHQRFDRRLSARLVSRRRMDRFLIGARSDFGDVHHRHTPGHECLCHAKNRQRSAPPNEYCCLRREPVLVPRWLSGGLLPDCFGGFWAVLSSTSRFAATRQTHLHRACNLSRPTYGPAPPRPSQKGRARSGILDGWPRAISPMPVRTA
jgi:hypothetical protein